MNERLRIATLLGLTTVVYGNTLLNGFALDDYLYIFNNPAVTSPSVRGLFAATKDFNVFRPVTFATLALNWAAGGAHAWGYHLVNLLLHAAVTLLLYLVLRKLLEIVPQGATVAWAAALLFAVHPIHTEAVASIVGRSELLAVGFLLAAWLLHLHDQPIPALFCFAVALLAKESAVVFVPLAIAGDYARGKLKPLLRYGWIAGVGVLYMAVLWEAQGGRFGEKGVNFLDNPLAQLPASLRILNALRVAWKYLALHIYPATLSCDYSYNGILLYSNLRHTLPPAVLAASVLALWIWAIWTKRKEWVLAGAIYLVGFSVTANILVPTGTIMGERLAYLPSAGFCLLVALAFIRLGYSNRKLATAAFAILVAALAMRTVVRNRDWRDNFTLFSAAVRAVPGSARAHAGLGGEYLRRDQLQEARREFQTSLSIYPDFSDVWNSSGIVETRLGHDQEALRLFQKSLEMTRKDDVNYNRVASNLAEQLIKLRRTDDALRLVNDQISKSPEDSRTRSIRAVIWYQRGEQASARADAEAALRLDPSNMQAQSLLGVLNKSGPRALQP
ncbi:MAG TPA: tetratricopeptide repeat protein [Candidatus Acidoferrales bacterium]|jgi:tetratricopeptide (TPR) repeat protein|nr:tetratricopeptide repeat protein [Candidatus Acidoferrales bacterium]